MRLADRYLLRELMTPFFISVVAILMMLVGNTLYKYLETLLREKWPLELVARWLLLNIPTVLVMALPVSTAMGAALASSRLARDNEITVLRSSGVSLLRIFLPISLFGLVIAGLNFLVFEKVTPWAWKEQQNTLGLLDALPTNPTDASRRIQAENFTITFANAQKISKNVRRINQVVLSEQNLEEGENFPQMTTAAYAQYENSVWKLKSVAFHRFNKDGTIAFDGVARTGTLLLNIDLTNFTMGGQPLTSSFLYTLTELQTQAKSARQFGNLRQAREFETDGWLKFALPLQSLVFAFIAPLLSLRFARSGAFTGILLSLVVTVAALILLLVLRALSLNGFLPPIVAAWLPMALFLTFGFFLLRTQE